MDVLAAVRLAETWDDLQVFANEAKRISQSATLNSNISDHTTQNHSLTMAAGLTVEHAEVVIDRSHQRWGGLIIKLISPDGTESILMNRNGKAPGSDISDLGNLSSGRLHYQFGSEFHRGEDSGGTWTLQISDAATGYSGTLTNWTLR